MAAHVEHGALCCVQACNRETLWWGVCVLDKEVDEAGGLAPETSANSPNSPFVVRREGALYAQGRSDR